MKIIPSETPTPRLANRETRTSDFSSLNAMAIKHVMKQIQILPRTSRAPGARSFRQMLVMDFEEVLCPYAGRAQSPGLENNDRPNIRILSLTAEHVVA
jgi:hypothetical protein